MELGKDMEMEIFNQAHINRVLMEIESTFPVYFDSFRSQQISLLFIQAIMDYEAEQQAYKDYMNVKGLDEFEDDPTSFKRETKTKCPIIRRCLNSQDAMMKQYKIAFNERTGRQMLDGVCLPDSFNIKQTK